MYFYVHSYRIAMSKTRLVKELEEFRRRRGLTQGELASQLGVSQPHLSRIISGAVAPGNKLEFRMAQLIDGKPRKKFDEWLDQVRRASGRSPAFRALVNSALEIMKKR
jgi:transcriptional regulator with XRE-family HTH domain